MPFQCLAQKTLFSLLMPLSLFLQSREMGFPLPVTQTVRKHVLTETKLHKHIHKRILSRFNVYLYVCRIRVILIVVVK